MRVKFAVSERWLVWFVPIILVGCGNGDRPPLGTVTGMVTLNGGPLRNVEVTFTPEVGRPSYGKTNAEGWYELDYIHDIKGAKVGKHTIAIRSGKVVQPMPKVVEIEPGKNQIDILCKPSSEKSSQTEDED